MPNHNFIDETGKQYGELTVLYRAENTSGGRAMCRIKYETRRLISRTTLW